jgi:hypothetical protein
MALLSGLLVAAAPAHATDTVPPVIKTAVMGDTNRNDHADRVTLTYSEPINHLDDKDGTFPFSVSGYTIREVMGASASKKLVLRLLELPTTDISNRPQIVYFQTAQQPVVDLAGNQASAQTFKRTKPLDLDGDGYTAVGGDCAPKDASIHPGAVDQPDLGFIDTNCDGIDGDAAKAVFVSPVGSDSNPGTKASPMLTVPAGVSAAAAHTPAFAVYVAVGTYSGSVALATGVGVYGGYDPASWARPATGATTISGSPAALAQGATGVVLQLLTLEGGTSGSSYGLLAIQGSDVTLDGVTVQSGAGDAGTAGSVGGIGNNGGDGGSPSGAAKGTAGTGIFSGGVGGAGGSGLVSGTAGGSGQPSGVGGGTGGAGGAGRYGVDGTDGGPGAGTIGPGGPGAGGAGSYLSSGFGAGNGVGGFPGQAGAGGGGGGGGGGLLDCLEGPPCFSYAGGGGGGGGGGGSGGEGGAGGTGGGGSFGIYAFDSQVTILAGGCTITAGDGGSGGSGAGGGTGGAGGSGGTGSGGLGGGLGGNGGAGQYGTAGGTGGGGAGGPSIGIFHGGSSTLTGTANATITHGSGGAGGTAPNPGQTAIGASIYP